MINLDPRDLLTRSKRQCASLVLCIACLLLFGCPKSRDWKNMRYYTAPEEQSTLRVYLGVPHTLSLPALYWEGGKAPIGMEPDLAVAVATELGRQLRLVTTSDVDARMERRFTLLESGAVDIVIYSFSITESRKQRVSFSTPYFMDGVSALVASGAPIHKESDMSGKRVLTDPNTTSWDWAVSADLNIELVTEMVPGMTRNDMVASGKVDAALDDASSLFHDARTDPRVRVTDRFTEEPWGIAVRKGNNSMLAEINAALETLKRTGKLDEIQRKWTKGVALDPVR